ncbi:hypothetical protein EDD17DRAFT_1512548 [Pisolithus thermaeus]|nr:hypothetical protein EDD17DRAFT_1512548 [Pisolithus thermaeus]
MQLSPQHVKWLRTYAKELCSTLEIPKKSILDFIETGNLFHMVINMKASLIKYEINTHANKFNTLQETLSSKDFEISLHNCLLVCLLSLNITAYVMDVQRHIMDFIFEHQDIFKIPAGVFDNSELKSSLCTIVSRFVQVINYLTEYSSRMELEATHWNRMAFLHCCLHIFLIGTGDLKNIPLDICFMPCLITMLKTNMQKKRVSTEGDTTASEDPVGFTHSDEAHSKDIIRDGAVNPGFPEGEGSVDDADVDAGGITDIEDNDDELSKGDSGFRLEGKPVHFNSSQFWNYINYMLNLLCEMARKGTSTKEEFEKGVANIMMQIFQDDLLDCPGCRKATRLMVANPLWQSTIQHELMW